MRPARTWARHTQWLLAAAVVPLPAVAGARETKIEFNIAAGPLDRALTQYAQTTRRQLLYSSALVANRTSPGLRGQHSADRALALLLVQTGLRVRRAGNAYVLVAASPSRATAETVRSPVDRRSRPIEARPPAPTPVQPEAEPAPIVVTGSHIRGAGAGSSPLVTVSRDEIDRAGQSTVGAAIAALPQNFGGTSSEDTSLTSSDRSTYNEGLGSGANLRGLGSDATLTLINGRRVAGAGGQAEFTDISMIPLAAVERIEVLTDGASAIYGSDAVGGVINVILRKTFKGGETRFYSGVPTQGGASEIQLGQVVGTAWEGGHMLVAYEYSRRERLTAAQRDYTRTADLRSLGGSDWRSFLSNPGTILGFSSTGALVPLYAVPSGQNGRNLTPGDFRPGANLENFREHADTLPRQERHSGYATIEQELSDKVRLFAEGRYGRRDFSFNGQASTAILQVLPNNPYFVSPTGAPFTLVGYSFARELGPIRQRGRIEAWNAAAGLTMDAFDDWQIDAHGSYSAERSRLRGSNYVQSHYLNEALGTRPDDPSTAFSTTTHGFFNPFGDGAVNSRAILDFIGQGWTATRLDSRVASATLKADGTLFELSGGRVRLAIGGTYRHDQFERDGENFTSDPIPRPFNRTNAGRSVTAGFAELAIPVFGEGNVRPGLRRLTLSAAVRHERYSDFGDTTNPKLGLVWEPAEGLTLRGSYGTSFRAPAIRELRDPLTVSYSPLRDIDGKTLSVMTLFGGNPDLKPETARSLTLGLRYSPPDAKRWRFELGYFETHFRDRIERPAADNITQALTNPVFAPYVRRVDPVGSAADRALLLDYLNHPGSLLPPSFYPPEFFRAILDARLVNSTRLTVRGIDFAVNGGFAAGGGEVSLALSASHMIDYQRQITPLAAAIEQVGTLADPPSWRGRASASFDRSSWGASTTLNYTNSYLEDGQPAQCSRLLAAGLRILRCAQGAGHGASIRQATSQRMFAAPERG
ncbi:TonB-dependent receptor [Sphingomonas koreensis]|uniref:TonB-dependent receptor n=1 Tax=Sphingomonas koreensis TaxID=93064 RepID=UPI000F7EAD7C|nr:TonB-dependent receptor [Sphingomonas koreensis]